MSVLPATAPEAALRARTSRPAPSGRNRPSASPETGLAHQERRRQATLRRLAKLREKAAAEIERLIAFLDASDPYAAAELEDAIDDHPCDTDELEQDLVHSGGLLGADWDGNGDLEKDDCDDEPSLGWTESEAACGRRYAGIYGRTADLEEQSDDEGVTI